MQLESSIHAIHPLLVTDGEKGLAAFVSLVRAVWAEDKDFVIDLAELTGQTKCTIEFRRGD